MKNLDRYSDVATMLAEVRPIKPVYCVFPHVYAETAKQFVDGFPGRVLYAVKAGSEPPVLRILVDSGIAHFDCASLPEIEIVRSVSADVTCYFMVPVRMRDEARIAQQEYGVRHFILDHVDGIAALAGEIDMQRAVVFARMAVHDSSAMYDLSTKFGAATDDMPELIQRIAETGAEPALAFNVGSSVTSASAYQTALSKTAELLDKLPLKIRLLDVGGGYPRSYPGFVMPPLQEYFDGIRSAASSLPLAENAEILGEPGRAMAAPGVSAVSEVIARKGDSLYINDGMHGIFWELRYRGHNMFPHTCYRLDGSFAGERTPYTVYGPTCDSVDVLPAQVELPADIEPGDYLEFGRLGAYSLSGRTDFNGRYSDHLVLIDDASSLPPGHEEYRN